MTPRNRILVMALGAAVVVGAVVGVWSLRTRDDWVRVVSTRTLADKGVVFDRRLNVYVVRSPEGPLALSAKVPHERPDYVRFCPSSGLFESDFLGAKFDRLGIYYGGPGERSLDRLESKVEDEIVYVNPDDISPGVARGEQNPIPPRGGFCEPT